MLDLNQGMKIKCDFVLIPRRTFKLLDLSNRFYSYKCKSNIFFYCELTSKLKARKTYQVADLPIFEARYMTNEKLMLFN